MKPAAFAYERARSVEAAVELLTEQSGGKILAGGQTLGPMLNLRLVQPERLIDITRIEELVRAAETGEAVILGACVSHAAIEDGYVPDPAHGALRRVAKEIAYRAVRTRGTIGGSLAHADPAADWLNTLLALRAELEIAGPEGRRRVTLSEFVQGVMETDLAENEIIAAIHVPKLPEDARLGFHKICRKTGEFADAIGAVVVDRKGPASLMVAGAGANRPIVFEDMTPFFKHADPLAAEAFDLERAMQVLQQAGLGDDEFELQIHAVALRRAFEEALAA